MRFSETFTVSRTRADWFDPLLDQDTPLYVDPFLVFDDNKQLWKDSRQEVVDFFDTAAQLIERANGNTESPAFQKAVRLLHFPEPNEFALGLSMGAPNGSGTGVDFAQAMAAVLNLVHKYGHVADLASLEGFRLFTDGIGRDRVSDILCNILKHRFIAYTQAIAKRCGISTEGIMVRHADWDRKNGRWLDLNVQLPRSSENQGGVLLTPERFLKDLPSITLDGFWSWAEVMEAQALRDDFGYDIIEGLNQTARRQRAREFARRHPDKAAAYIRAIDGRPHLPYDVEKDPKGLVRWREIGLAEGEKVTFSRSDAPKTNKDFHDFVDRLAETFRHQVEQADLWKALWANGIPQQEKVVQAIAGAMWTVACKGADVDLSQEVNRGRGPVDFKMSQGWTNRALVEIKLIHNSKFFQGASKQLPQYLATEQVDYGVYLCVGHFDRDFRPERLRKVQETADAIAGAKGVTIRVVIVDARKSNKVSASRLKD